jgi:hypothetical protein
MFMRTKVFDIPVDSIVEFSELLEENELEGTIIGTGEDSEIKVSVNYERENRDVILDLMEMLDGSDDEGNDD